MKPSSSTTDPATDAPSVAALPAPRGLFDELFGSPAMQEVFSDRARVQAMLDFEAALARAEAGAGVIPREAGEVIAGQCRAELVDLNAVARQAEASGIVTIPILRQLTELVARRDPQAARSVHWGATSQDVIDTGLVLQLRAALALVEADLLRLSASLARLAAQHRDTVEVGRTWLQPGPPVTFGLKAAGWLSAIERERARLRELHPRVLVLQFGGAVGTLAALGTEGLAVAVRLGQELGLGVPDLPWHTQRDRIAEVGLVLGLLTGTLGKLARDLSLLMQVEVAEVREPSLPGRGGSSTMPNKHNPVGAAVMLAAATRVPALVSTLLSAMVQEHERGLGGWEAEWETLPEICRLTAGALKHALVVVEGLTVDAERMRTNLDHTLGVVLAEPIAMALARHVGRGGAHELVAQACHQALAQKRQLREVLADEREVTSRLDAAELDRLCDPSRYLGLAGLWIDRVLAARERRATEPVQAPATIDVPGARLHYRLDGSPAAPLLVLASSLGTTLSMWDDQLVALTQGFRVLRYDMRGHGASSVSTEPVDISRLGQDVLALLDAVGASAASFLGLSLGGLVGLWLGAHAPERLHKLVLANTAAVIGTQASWDARIAAVAQGGVAAIVEPVLERWFSPPFRGREPERVDRVRRMLLATNREGYIAACGMLRATDLRESVARVSLPTLVVSGALDAATTPEEGRWLAEHIAGARYVELAAAHLSNIEASSAFNQSVSGFLQSSGGRDG